MPGTNTLMTARDALRAWRANGHAGEAALMLLTPGDFALTEPLVLDARDGNATWQAVHPEQTLITGGKQISGLAAGPDAAWHAAPGFHFEQFFVNGERATRSRFPAEGLLPLGELHVRDLPGKRALITVKVPAEAAAVLTAGAAPWPDRQILVFHKWDTTRYALTAFDPASGTITMEGQPMTSWDPWDAQSRYLLDNCAGPTLAPGTWLLGRAGDLSYHPLPGEAPGKTKCLKVVRRCRRRRGLAQPFKLTMRKT
jgi:hypothetical protein